MSALSDDPHDVFEVAALAAEEVIEPRVYVLRGRVEHDHDMCRADYERYLAFGQP